MNKISKLIVTVALIAAFASKGMVYSSEESLEVFGAPLQILNMTNDPIRIKWIVREQGEWVKPAAIFSGAHHKLAPISQVESVVIDGPRGVLSLDDRQLALFRAESGNKVTLEIYVDQNGMYKARSLKHGAHPESTTAEKAKIIGTGMPLLDWFPAVKAKLFAVYHGREGELTSADIRKMEHLLDQAQRAGSITVRDFLNLPDGYTAQDVERAYDQMEDRLFNTREERAIVSAIERQIKYARDHALALLHR